MAPRTALPRVAIVAALVLTGARTPAAAQSLGLFSWQLAPFCNVVTVEVIQTENVFRLQGADDQCGRGGLAPVAGIAYPQRDGTFGIGLQIVTAPGGAPVHVTASLRRSDLGGPWRDSAGNRGDMLPPFARRAGGEPRPEPVFGASFVQPADGPDRGLNVVVTADTGEVTGDAAALFGQFGEPSGFAQPGNAAVRGDSAADTGLLGTSASGSGVRGTAGGGVGVEGFADAGTGVRAAHGRGGTALEIANGALRVSGAVRPAFVHTTDPGNTRGDSSCLDHPLSNGLPDAMVLVTHRWGGSGVNVPSTGVYYDWDARRWCVFTESGATMPVGTSFNVLIVTQ
jgi:hypothetical protein